METANTATSRMRNLRAISNLLQKADITKAMIRNTVLSKRRAITEKASSPALGEDRDHSALLSLPNHRSQSRKSAHLKPGANSMVGFAVLRPTLGTQRQNPWSLVREGSKTTVQVSGIYVRSQSASG
jgi:hypothetical protein